MIRCISLTWLHLILNLIVYHEFKMLRDFITEIGEEKDIGYEAVKDFFEDLQNHYYDYVRLRESVAELKAEKAQLSARHATNYVSNKTESSIKRTKNVSLLMYMLFK